jgi:hypothetical protein
MSERNMTQETQAAPGRPSQTRRFRASAVVVIALAAGLTLWLALRDRGSSSQTAQVEAVSVNQIKARAAAVGHPIFWVGPKPGYTYELSTGVELQRAASSSIFLRYLPPGVKVGDKGAYLTVATYPYARAFASIQNVAKQSGIVSIALAQNGLAEYTKSNPYSVHLAYPGIDYQVEVFGPTLGEAPDIVRAGKVAAFGLKSLESAAPAKAPKPTAASPADLKSLATSLGHPLYWAGPKKRYTYELKHTTNGEVYVRYLPPGVKVGTKQPYLTVGTYPFPGAFAAIQGVAKDKKLVKIRLAGRGLALFDASDPEHIHLAYPGSEYQVEVFDPAAQARRIVASGLITSIG